MSDTPHPVFRSLGAPLDVDDAVLDRLNEQLGVPTLTKPAGSPPDVERTPVRTAEKLTIELPGYLMDALRQAAAGDRTTVRHVVMTALRGAGFAIAETDMVPDGRRARAKARMT